MDLPGDMQPICPPSHRRTETGRRVAEHAPARDVAGLRLAEHGIVGPLPRLVPLDLVSECRHRHEELFSRGVQGALAILQVGEDPHPGGDELLQRPRRLDLLAPEAILVHHDQDGEGGPRLERVHQPRKPGRRWNSAPEMAVIRIDVRLVDRPTLPHGIGARVLDLARDGLRLVRDAGLVLALAGVDGGDHRELSPGLKQLRRG